jgi:FkbM family methyltransferase
LEHLAGLGLSPTVIFDIGSASGDWARLAHHVWPSAAITGFEPNASREPLLQRTCAEVPGYRYLRCFLGASAGVVEYADQQDQTSLFMPQQNARGGASAPMLVLDDLIASGQVRLPQFMKLDVQGYELEVLKGARNALEASEAVLLEANCCHLSPEMPTVRDVLEFMWRADFFWYDILGLVRRASDDAMAHLDLLFLKNGHRLLRDSWE